MIFIISNLTDPALDMLEVICAQKYKLNTAIVESQSLRTLAELQQANISYTMTQGSNKWWRNRDKLFFNSKQTLEYLKSNPSQDNIHTNCIHIIEGIMESNTSHSKWIDIERLDNDFLCLINTTLPLSELDDCIPQKSQNFYKRVNQLLSIFEHPNLVDKVPPLLQNQIERIKDLNNSIEKIIPSKIEVTILTTIYSIFYNLFSNLRSILFSEQTTPQQEQPLHHSLLAIPSKTPSTQDKITSHNTPPSNLYNPTNVSNTTMIGSRSI